MDVTFECVLFFMQLYCLLGFRDCLVEVHGIHTQACTHKLLFPMDNRCLAGMSSTFLNVQMWVIMMEVRIQAHGRQEWFVSCSCTHVPSQHAYHT